MIINLDCEQNYYSRTATGLYKIGQCSIRIMKKLAYSEGSFYENINYYDLMVSILEYLN